MIVESVSSESIPALAPLVARFRPPFIRHGFAWKIDGREDRVRELPLQLFEVRQIAATPLRSLMVMHPRRICRISTRVVLVMVVMVVVVGGGDARRCPFR